MLKRIKQTLRDRIGNSVSNINKVITNINNGTRANRGLGTAGLKKDKSHYKLGGRG